MTFYELLQENLPKVTKDLERSWLEPRRSAQGEDRLDCGFPARVAFQRFPFSIIPEVVGFSSFAFDSCANPSAIAACAANPSTIEPQESSLRYDLEFMEGFGQGNRSRP
jgi:hypothetical protein